MDQYNAEPTRMIEADGSMMSTPLEMSALSSTAKKLKADPLPDVEFNRMEELRKMISPLSKEQMMDVLARAAAIHSDVYETAHQIVNESPASRRLMIRNIAFSTANEALHNKFVDFGEIEDSTVVREKESNKSKGFGFVTFKRADSVQAALRTPIFLDSRQLAVKLAADPIEDGPDLQDNKFRRKLFIRNLSDNTTTASLREYFEMFGPLEDAVVVKNADGKSKGFGFVTFQRVEDGVKGAQQAQRIIDGRMAFVSFASPSSGTNKSPGGFGFINSPPTTFAGGGTATGAGGFAGNRRPTEGTAAAGGYFRNGQFVGGMQMGGAQQAYVDQAQYMQQLQAMHAMQMGMTPAAMQGSQYGGQHAGSNRY